MIRQQAEGKRAGIALKEERRMAEEIERKFLVREGEWHPKGNGSRILQGYLCSVPERTVRVRMKDDRAYLTIKGKNDGIRRPEFEYEIPAADAAELIGLCEQPVIAKRRYLEEYKGFIWEIDVFEGENAGLVLAEIELPSEDTVFPLPAWAGEEVSADSRYYNSNLQLHPYCEWGNP